MKGVLLIFSPYVKVMTTARGSLSLARLACRSIEGCRDGRIQSRALTSSSSTIGRAPLLAPARRLPSTNLHSSRRFFATSSACLSSAPIKDPYHPSGLYFHQLPDSKRYAISFFSQPPSSPTSASIIAFITPPASNQEEIYDLVVQQPDLVEAHKPFLDLMHDTLKNECVPQDGLLEYEAYLRKDGWAHLNDQRHPLMPGRIATPENIIASVAFTDEKVRPESYEANGVYRIVTGEEGFMDLRPNWLMFIKNKCEQVN